MKAKLISLLGNNTAQYSQSDNVNERVTVRGAYLKVSNFSNRLFNFTLALILTIYALPLFVIISILIKFQNDGPIFYHGVRLGNYKKPFTMYKFRTLAPGAENSIGAQILTSNHRLMSTFGMFLRFTRLDELPQLINILKGDMEFVGPRPVRPYIYKKLCTQISGYDKRFTIKPGLIGYAQIFTPPSTPKRIRALIDNKFLRKKQNPLGNFLIISYTIVTVVQIILHELKILGKKILYSKIMNRYHEMRAFERIALQDAKVYIGPETSGDEMKRNPNTYGEGFRKNNSFTTEVKLIDINEEAIRVHSRIRLKHDMFIFRMERSIKRRYRGGRRRKRAICFGKICRESENINNFHKYLYIIKYTPVSPLNYYIVFSYFLSQSIADRVL